MHIHMSGVFIDGVRVKTPRTVPIIGEFGEEGRLVVHDLPESNVPDFLALFDEVISLNREDAANWEAAPAVAADIAEECAKKTAVLRELLSRVATFYPKPCSAEPHPFTL